MYRSILAILICSCGATSFAQTPRPADKPARPAGTEDALKIVVLQGEGALNNIKTNSATEPVIEVRDERDMPVAGADVTFQLPLAGAGGFFPGRKLTLTGRSNDRGQAAGTGFIPNDVPGRFNIKVGAASGNRAASTVISQTNTTDIAAAARATSSKSRKWKILAAVGGAAVTAGIIVATHSGGSSTPVIPNSLTITPGPITIGGPH